MNKIQYIELLKLRGIVKLEQGQSIADAVKQSGGDPTEKEMALVNYNSMVYYINKSTELIDKTKKLCTDSENLQASYQRQIEDLKHQVLKLQVENSNLKANRTKEVAITEAQLDELYDLRNWKNALEGAGVDNWEGYDIAMESYNEKEI